MQNGYYWFRWKDRTYSEKEADVVWVKDDEVWMVGNRFTFSIEHFLKQGEFLYTEPIRFKGHRS